MVYFLTLQLQTTSYEIPEERAITPIQIQSIFQILGVIEDLEMLEVET